MVTGEEEAMGEGKGAGHGLRLTWWVWIQQEGSPSSGGLAFLWEAGREVSRLPPGGLAPLLLNKLRLKQGQFQEPEV